MCPTKKTNHSEPFNPNPSANPQPCNPNANRGPTRVEVFVRGQEKKNGQTKKKNGENVDYVIIRYAWYVFSFGISILNVVDYLAPHIVSTFKMHVAGGAGACCSPAAEHVFSRFRLPGKRRGDGYITTHARSRPSSVARALRSPRGPWRISFVRSSPGSSQVARKADKGKKKKNVGHMEQQ